MDGHPVVSGPKGPRTVGVPSDPGEEYGDTNVGTAGVGTRG